MRQKIQAPAWAVGIAAALAFGAAQAEQQQPQAQTQVTPTGAAMTSPAEANSMRAVRAAALPRQKKARVCARAILYELTPASTGVFDYWLLIT